MSTSKTKYDLSGKKFGKLTVISYAGKDITEKNSVWMCKCECGNQSVVCRPSLIQGHTHSCGCLTSPPREDYDLSRERDFFRFVEKTDTCWLWKGCLDKSGYGMFAYRDKKVKAHRYAFERFKGPIKGGNFVCHTCDIPACVNPEHLYLGTHLDNMKDVVDRKRWGLPRIELDSKKKRACELLFKNGFSLHEIAEVLNISHQCAKKYSRGEDASL